MLIKRYINVTILNARKCNAIILKVCCPVYIKNLFSLIYLQEDIKYRKNQPAREAAKKNTIFVILPDAISTLPYLLNKHKIIKDITINLYLSVENLLYKQVLCKNTPAWNTINAAKKLCKPSGNFKLYIETTVAPAIHINTLT